MLRRLMDALALRRAVAESRQRRGDPRPETAKLDPRQFGECRHSHCFLHRLDRANRGCAPNQRLSPLEKTSALPAKSGFEFRNGGFAGDAYALPAGSASSS